MENYMNISITAKDYENGELLIILDIFRDNSMYLKVLDKFKNKLVVDKQIKNQRLLNIINAFLADARFDMYDLKDSDYCELYVKYVELIAYWIISDYHKASLLYNEIKLINFKEY